MINLCIGLVVNGTDGPKCGVLQPGTERCHIGVDGWVVAVATGWYTGYQSVQYIVFANFADQTAASVTAAHRGQWSGCVSCGDGTATTATTTSRIIIIIIIFLIVVFIILVINWIRLGWWWLILSAELIAMQCTVEYTSAWGILDDHLTRNHQSFADYVGIVTGETETGHLAIVTGEEAAARNSDRFSITCAECFTIGEQNNGQVIFKGVRVEVLVNESATGTWTRCFTGI